MTAIPVELWEAYRRAEYRVGPVTLKVGEPAEFSADNQPWAYLTAWNPASQLCPDDENRKNQERLELKLQDLGLACIAGVAHDPGGAWQDEEGVLVIGLSQSAAIELGREFGQNALLAGIGGGVVELVSLL